MMCLLKHSQILPAYLLFAKHPIAKQQQAKSFVCLLLLFAFTSTLSAQPIPVHDRKHNDWSRILEQVQTASLVIHARVSLVVNKISTIQDFISKAHSIVNGFVKNIHLVNQIIKMHQDIVQIAEEAITQLNEPRDMDLDGEDDLYYLDKWRHVQILLAIAGQADSLWELFENTLEDDAFIMDDKGRLTIIQQTYQESRAIRTALRSQIRRINKEIYEYQIRRREVLAFEAIFSAN